VIAAAERLSWFVVGLTNEDPATSPPVWQNNYEFVQYPGSLAAGEMTTLAMPPTAEKYRYVIVQQRNPPDGIMCISTVAVFIRRTFFIAKL